MNSTGPTSRGAAGLPPPHREHVCVVGGGAIGAAVAYHLSLRGRRVTVVEKGDFGRGSSWGNCGIVLPGHVLPLASWDNLVAGLRWMLRKDAPLYIAPRPDPALWTWMLRFALCSRPGAIHRSALGIAPMLRHAVDDFTDLFQRERMDCGWRRGGAYHLYRSEASLAAHAAVDARIRRYAHGEKRVERRQLRRAVPTVGDAVAGAWKDEGAAHLRPEHLMREWKRVLAARGVEILERTEWTGFRRSGGRVAAADTDRGPVAADAFVVATGAWTPLLAGALGVRVPIQPGKGYAVTFPGVRGFPPVPCFFAEERVVATPWEDGARLGGTMEFAGWDEAIHKRRIRSLTRAARKYLPSVDFGDPEEEWYGWRPMTFDGLPVIDRLPGVDNAMIAAGHNMLGISMAPATGRLTAEMLCGEPPHIDPRPYRLSRFGRPVRRP